jgi:3-oxoacyl-[acyl-carrier-protein] synthase-3
MYAPERALTNQDLEKMVLTNDQWIVERTGIRTRRVAEAGTATSDLCMAAALEAMGNAGTDPSEIDIIIVGTCTPDMPLPSTACFLQMKLGAARAYAMDVNAACSGFMYALSVADSLIRAGRGRKALVVGAEVLSSVVDYQDRSTCILFGDGAGAVVLAECPDGEGVLSTHLHSDGGQWELIYCPGGGSAYPVSHDIVDKRMGYIRMNGNETFKQAVLRLVEVTRDALETNGLKGEDVTLFIPHQANLRIINAVGKRLSIPEGRTYVNVDRYGNTSAASIPIALAEAVAQGRVKKGDIVLMAAFGAGLTWGSVIVRF